MKLTLKPSTQLGWWPIGFAIGYFVLMPLWRVIPLNLGAFPAFISGVIGSICGLIAIARQEERSLLVYFTLIPIALVLFFLAAEFLFPH
jgi:hypothetical protein